MFFLFFFQIKHKCTFSLSHSDGIIPWHTCCHLVSGYHQVITMITPWHVLINTQSSFSVAFITRDPLPLPLLFSSKQPQRKIDNHVIHHAATSLELQPWNPPPPSLSFCLHTSHLFLHNSSFIKQHHTSGCGRGKGSSLLLRRRSSNWGGFLCSFKTPCESTRCNVPTVSIRWNTSYLCSG